VKRRLDMKKFMVLLMALVLSLGMLVSCDESESATDETVSETAAQQPAATAAPAQTVAD